MPRMKPAGMKTLESTSAMPTSAPPTSSIAAIAASCGVRPSSIFAWTASTTTIASSTTSPTARTRPRSESVLIVKPTIGKKRKVPIRDTGMVWIGTHVARKLSRKRNTTRRTRPIASASVMRISFAPSVTGMVVSSVRSACMSDGKRSARRAMAAFTRLAASRAFEPGTW